MNSNNCHWYCHWYLANPILGKVTLREQSCDQPQLIHPETILYVDSRRSEALDDGVLHCRCHHCPTNKLCRESNKR